MLGITCRDHAASAAQGLTAPLKVGHISVQKRIVRAAPDRVAPATRRRGPDRHRRAASQAHAGAIRSRAARRHAAGGGRTTTTAANETLFFLDSLT
jgi:hypothetical protein